MKKFKSVEQLLNWLKKHKKLIFKSSPKEMTRFRILLHSLSSGDFNPAHCVSNFVKHSIFKSVVSHGIGVVARAEAEFLQLLRFAKQPEVIALGIKDLSYIKPLRCGDIYEYVFEISNLRKGKRFWSMDCRIVCQVIVPEERIVAEWIWFPAFVEHDLPDYVLEKLEPKSYVWNVIRSFLLDPRGPFITALKHTSCLLFLISVITSFFFFVNRPLTLQMMEEGFGDYFGSGP